MFKQKLKPGSKGVAGFTIIELLVVVAIIGILSAIAAPSWLAFLTRQRLNSAQAEAMAALREAQANAKREKRIWQTCFHDDGTQVRWAVRARPVAAGQDGCDKVSPGLWQNLNLTESDLLAIDTSRSTDGLRRPAPYYRIEFEDKGLLAKNQTTGTITFIPKGQPNSTGRCVAVETILGALRAGGGDECRQSTSSP